MAGPASPNLWAHIGSGKGLILVSFAPAGLMESFFRIAATPRGWHYRIDNARAVTRSSPDPGGDVVDAAEAQASLEAVLKDEIIRMYQEVADTPDAEFHFYHGREAADAERSVAASDDRKSCPER